ncbi:MAG TPA: amidohydrolase family protein [Pyrinomonadaceae bacterium]|nr:amidohydrolase family protein [Pyrinomonadaceae bacterium]
MKPRNFLALLLVLVLNPWALAGGALPRGQNKTPAVVAFMNVNVVPMDKEGVLENQTVIVSDGRISEMGAASKVKVPKGATRIEAKGRYLMPGLVDMHAHLYATPELPLYLANGVTTVYNLNGRPANLVWREEVKQGKLAGPTIYTCGPTIRTAQKAEEARRLVEEQSKAGYDSIKIYNGVSKEAYDVLIAEAKRHNMLYIGHIPREPGFESVLKAGQAIAHAEEYVYTTFKNNVDDESRIPEVAAATRDAGVQVVLTFVAYDHIIKQVETLPALLATPEMKYLAPWVYESWGVDVNPYKRNLGTQGAALNKSLAFQKKLAKELHRVGVRIMTGTDAMNPGVVPGFSEHEELRQLIDIGFTPFEAIRAATRYPAEFLTKTGEFGTVAVGKRADLLLIDGNPLQDISRISRPLGVMARGRWMPQAELQRMLEGVPAAYAKQVEIAKAGLAEGSEKIFDYLNYNDPTNTLLAKSAGDVIVEQGVEKFKRTFEIAWKRDQTSPLVQESFVNNLGYYLVNQKKLKDAIEVFKLNVAAYPKSGNTYDSLAEAYMKNGDNAHAIEFYQKAIDVEPTYANAKEAAELVKKLSASGQ